MLKALDVANFFVEMAKRTPEDEMTNMRVNKLLYFAQGLSLTTLERLSVFYKCRIPRGNFQLFHLAIRQSHLAYGSTAAGVAENSELAAAAAEKE